MHRTPAFTVSAYAVRSLLNHARTANECRNCHRGGNARHERVPAVLGQRASGAFRDVERQQQRQPLARAADAAHHTG